MSETERTLPEKEMKTKLRLTIALLVTAAAVPIIAWHSGRAAQRTPEKEQEEKFHRAAKPVSDRYIVVLKRETPSDEVESTTNELLAQHGGNVGYIYKNAIKGFSIQMPEAAAIALSRNPKVEYVEEDGEAALNKTEVTGQWNLELWKKLPDAMADYVNQLDVPTTMLPGQTVLVGVAMKNVSRTTWTAAQGFKLASQGDTMTWGPQSGSCVV